MITPRFLALLFLAPALMVGCSSVEQNLSPSSEQIPAVALPETTVSHQEGQATYEPYSSARLEQLKGKEKFTLFFHASWCPTCRKMETNFLQNLSNLGQAIILKADYDTELALQKEYGVTTQSTVLFFDDQGLVVKKEVDPSIAMVQDFFAQ